MKITTKPFLLGINNTTLDEHPINNCVKNKDQNETYFSISPLQ